MVGVWRGGQYRYPSVYTVWCDCFSLHISKNFPGEYSVLYLLHTGWNSTFSHRSWLIESRSNDQLRNCQADLRHLRWVLRTRHLTVSNCWTFGYSNPNRDRPNPVVHLYPKPNCVHEHQSNHVCEAMDSFRFFYLVDSSFGPFKFVSVALNLLWICIYISRTNSYVIVSYVHDVD